MTIRIVLVDDEAVTRAGIRVLLNAEPDMEVVGEAADGKSAEWRVRKLRPDVVITDLGLAELDGIALTQRIRTGQPDTHVVSLTSVNEEDEALVRSIHAGAMGYVMKNADVSMLLQAIRAAARGQVMLSTRAAQRLVRKVRRPGPLLTLREREVLRHLATGRSNKQIAADLSITDKTVKAHVSAVLDKLGVQTRTQAAVYAVQSALVPPDAFRAA
jgi:DNA-binding NarL/FixJ family response regulator